MIPGFIPGIDVRGQEKPCYPEGTRVALVDFSGLEGQHGTIVGVVYQHVIDLWIVKLDKLLPNWGWSCITVPHTHLKAIEEDPKTEPEAAAKFPVVVQEWEESEPSLKISFILL